MYINIQYFLVVWFKYLHANQDIRGNLPVRPRLVHQFVLGAQKFSNVGSLSTLYVHFGVVVVKNIT